MASRKTSAPASSSKSLALPPRAILFAVLAVVVMASLAGLAYYGWLHTRQAVAHDGLSAR